MATSGVITTNVVGGYSIRSTWTLASQDIALNQSTVNVNHEFIVASQWPMYNVRINADCTFGGDTKSVSYIVNSAGGQTLQMGTTTHVVSHNADGTFDGTIFTKSVLNLSWVSGTMQATGEVDLTTIPRTSSFTIADNTLNFGQTASITINRASTTFLHQVVYTFGEYSQKFDSVSTSNNFVIPLTWMNAIANYTTGTCKVTVSTYSGNTLIGSVSQNITLYVQSSIIPTFTSVTALPTPTIFENTYIQNNSAIKAQINGAQGIYGSTITNYTIALSTGNVGTTASYTSPIINRVGTVTVTATITDSRGRKATKSINVTYQAYAVASLLNSTIVQRVNELGEADENGDRVQITPIVSISSVAGLNAIDVLRYRYKTSTGSWSSFIDATSGTTTYFDANVDNTYEIEIEVSDLVQSTTSIYKFNINSSFSVMDFKANKRGLAIAGASEIDDAVEIKNNWDLYVYGQKVDVVIEEGSNADGKYIKYASGKLECIINYELTVQENEWSAIGSLFYFSDVFRNFPHQFVDTPDFAQASFVSLSYTLVNVNLIAKRINDVRMQFIAFNKTARTMQISVFAVGKWK